MGFAIFSVSLRRILKWIYFYGFVVLFQKSGHKFSFKSYALSIFPTFLSLRCYNEGLFDDPMENAAGVACAEDPQPILALIYAQLFIIEAQTALRDALLEDHISRINARIARNNVRIIAALNADQHHKVQMEETQDIFYNVILLSFLVLLSQ